MAAERRGSPNPSAPSSATTPASKPSQKIRLISPVTIGEGALRSVHRPRTRPRNLRLHADGDPRFIHRRLRPVFIQPSPSHRASQSASSPRLLVRSHCHQRRSTPPLLPSLQHPLIKPAIRSTRHLQLKATTSLPIFVCNLRQPSKPTAIQPKPKHAKAIAPIQRIKSTSSQHANDVDGHYHSHACPILPNGCQMSMLPPAIAIKKKEKLLNKLPRNCSERGGFRSPGSHLEPQVKNGYGDGKCDTDLNEVLPHRSSLQEQMEQHGVLQHLELWSIAADFGVELVAELERSGSVA